MEVDGKIQIIGIIIIGVVILAVAGGGFLFITEMSKTIIDTRAFFSGEYYYSATLKAGTTISVEMDVLEGGPVILSIWNDTTEEELIVTGEIYSKYSSELNILSDGEYIFDLTSFELLSVGDESVEFPLNATVHLKVVQK